VEGMSSSSLTMHDGTFEDDLLGYKDGVNYIKVNKNNFIEKIQYYLENDDERSEIVKNANALIKDRHTIQQRVQEFIELIKNG
jgi:spore maturation protein CgeB